MGSGWQGQSVIICVFKFRLLLHKKKEIGLCPAGIFKQDRSAIAEWVHPARRNLQFRTMQIHVRDTMLWVRHKDYMCIRMVYLLIQWTAPYCSPFRLLDVRPTTIQPAMPSHKLLGHGPPETILLE